MCLHPRHAPSLRRCPPCCPPGPATPTPRPGRDDDPRIHRHRPHPPRAVRASGGRAVGPLIQPEYLTRVARAHEESGFDRVLVAHSSASPDGFTIADQVLDRTERIGVLLAHRPGFVSPTYAARKYATLDAFHPGRIALHTITGGDDAEQARDGDLPTRRPATGAPTSSCPSCARSGPPRALRLLRRVLHCAGRLVRGAPGARRHPGLLRRRLRGRDPGRRQARRRLRVLGRAAGRHPPSGSSRCAPPPRRTAATRFSVSLRPDPGRDREAAAWDRADEVLRLTRERAARRGALAGSGKRDQAAAPRLAAAAGVRGAGRRARQAAVDRGSEGDRRGRQLHRPGRLVRAGGRGAARVRGGSASAPC